MKLIYLILSAGFVFGFAFPSYSQIQEIPAKPKHGLSRGIKTDNPILQKGVDRVLEYWSEDFSNGLSGQDGNGLWTVSGEQGALWFQTFPEELDNGYDGDAPLEGYGDFLPYFWLETDILNSETRDNGVIMIDADRYNSTRTTDDIGEYSLNTLDAQLISPSINLSGIDQALLHFSHKYRLCCEERTMNLEFSTNGGEDWIVLNVFENTETLTGNEELYEVDFSNILSAAADLSNCKIRFSFSETDSHFYWIIDDIFITSLRENDLVAGATFYNDYHKHLEGFANGNTEASQYYKGFEYTEIPSIFQPTLNFAMVVTNNGAQMQTGVQLEVIRTFPEGIESDTLHSDPIDIQYGATDTLTIDSVSILEIPDYSLIEEGYYSFSYKVVQNEIDDIPSNNIGEQKSILINEFYDYYGMNYFWNGSENCGATYVDYGQDVIWSTSFSFEEIITEYYFQELSIVGVEAIFYASNNIAESVVGETIYFNVREGNILAENPNDPETFTSVLYDSENRLDYEPSNSEYQLTGGEFYDPQNDDEYSWKEIYFNSPIIIENDKTYSAEFRVPASEAGIVFPVVCSGEEPYSSYMYSFADSTWYHLGENAVQIRFLVDFAIGLDEISTNGTLTLHQNYPNPAIDQTSIRYQLKNSGNVNFELIDIHGKLIYSEKLGNIAANALQTYDFDLSQLASGMYFYSIVQNGERISRKLIKQ